jgi:hypothetical protein
MAPAGNLSGVVTDAVTGFPLNFIVGDVLSPYIVPPGSGLMVTWTTLIGNGGINPGTFAFFGGTGYAQWDILQVPGGTIPALLYVTSVNGSGTPLTVDVGYPGEGYSAPSLTGVTTLNNFINNWISAFTTDSGGAFSLEAPLNVGNYMLFFNIFGGPYQDNTSYQVVIQNWVVGPATSGTITTTSTSTGTGTSVGAGYTTGVATNVNTATFTNTTTTPMGTGTVLSTSTFTSTGTGVTSGGVAYSVAYTNTATFRTTGTSMSVATTKTHTSTFTDSSAFTATGTGVGLQH